MIDKGENAAVGLGVLGVLVFVAALVWVAKVGYTKAYDVISTLWKRLFGKDVLPDVVTNFLRWLEHPNFDLGGNGGGRFGVGPDTVTSGTNKGREDDADDDAADDTTAATNPAIFTPGNGGGLDDYDITGVEQ